MQAERGFLIPHLSARQPVSPLTPHLLLGALLTHTLNKSCMHTDEYAPQTKMRFYRHLSRSTKLDKRMKAKKVHFYHILKYMWSVILHRHMHVCIWSILHKIRKQCVIQTWKKEQKLGVCSCIFVMFSSACSTVKIRLCLCNVIQTDSFTMIFHDEAGKETCQELRKEGKEQGRSCQFLHGSDSLGSPRLAIQTQKGERGRKKMKDVISQHRSD